MRPSEGAHLCHGLPDGGSPEGEPRGDRGLRCACPARPGEGQVHPAERAQGGEHRHGEELPEPVRGDQRHGGEVRHASAVQLPPEEPPQAGGDGVPAGPEGARAGAAGLPRLQLPADALVMRGERQRHASRGELVLRVHRQAHLGGLHQDEHREAGGPRQGVLHTQRHRHQGAPAVRRARRQDDRRRQPRHPCPRLHRRRLQQGRQDHPVICRCSQQDGVEERIIIDKSIILWLI